MTKKLGPLKVWHWGVLVGGGLGLFLLLHKKKGVEEPGPRLVGSALQPGGAEGPGGGGLGGEGLRGEAGPIGEPGPAGVPGAEGKPGEVPPNVVAEINRISEQLNNPPTAASRSAPKAIAKRKPTKGHHRKPAQQTKKQHQEAHQKAHRENRGRVHAPKATHGGPTHGGAVAHRQHGPPKGPVHVQPHTAPHHNAPHHAAPSKPAKRRHK